MFVGTDVVNCDNIQRMVMVEDVWVTAVGWKVGRVPREIRSRAGSRVRVSGFTAS